MMGILYPSVRPYLGSTSDPTEELRTLSRDQDTSGAQSGAQLYPGHYHAHTALCTLTLCSAHSAHQCQTSVSYHQPAPGLRSVRT